MEKVGPKKWWSEVKRLCNFKTKEGLSNLTNVAEFSNLSLEEQASRINKIFLDSLNEYSLQFPLPKLPLEESPVFPNLSEIMVHKALSKLKINSAAGPDEIPNWCLKEYSLILALPVSLILNASYKEQRLPTLWKKADVIPLPKTKIVQQPKKDLRPISLTSCISKIAEEFLVNTYVKPAVLKVIDPHQYGVIPKSSTTMALISMLHHWFHETDGNGSVIRTILFDYRKAFDLIDHSILFGKLSQLDIPRSVANWIIDFLTHRFQRIKLGNFIFSSWESVPAGVPQGTKLGPWLFILLINDLNISQGPLWKYVDDSTTSEIALKNGTSKAQDLVDEVICWSDDNKMQLNAEKCKELRISFNVNPVEMGPIVVNGKNLEVVQCIKLLGLTINSKLTWNDHIDDVVKKINKRLYLLSQLKRAKVKQKDLALFYTSCIRSVADYAIPAIYYSLPQYLKNDLIRVEKRAIAIIMPNVDYRDALELLNIKPMEIHHENLCDNLFRSVLLDTNHKISHLLPQRHDSGHFLRNENNFNIPFIKTDRTKDSFVFAMCNKLNKSC